MPEQPQCRAESPLPATELTVQALADEGITVKLLRNEHPETGAAMALVGCALLVRAEDEATVRARIAGLGY
ncbi:MAG: hypothetical protein GY745_21190 [Actinomycetia bacterium]|nr:hypothetical protein [Actinomycetes bacterium]MCP3911458.1 hypothetical protein [Actinomycetes bacterium]MCP4087535.1 hypothetical protein [Actinomycetes bacterium]